MHGGPRIERPRRAAGVGPLPQSGSLMTGIDPAGALRINENGLNLPQDLSWIIRARGSFTLPVQGSSMTPLIQSGDVVRIVATAARSIKPGDVIAFFRGTTLVVHRVVMKRVRRNSLLIYEKGDAGPAGSWIRYGQITGRVVSINRSGSRVSLDSCSARILGRLLGELGMVCCTVGFLGGSRQRSGRVSSPSLRERHLRRTALRAVRALTRVGVRGIWRLGRPHPHRPRRAIAR